MSIKTRQPIPISIYNIDLERLTCSLSNTK